ncbi:hypothetical protein M422DRAFT_269125, partial [Sphaerobolus stellatus SS14]
MAPRKAGNKRRLANLGARAVKRRREESPEPIKALTHVSNSQGSNNNNSDTDSSFCASPSSVQSYSSDLDSDCDSLELENESKFLQFSSNFCIPKLTIPNLQCAILTGYCPSPTSSSWKELTLLNLGELNPPRTFRDYLYIPSQAPQLERLFIWEPLPSPDSTLSFGVIPSFTLPKLQEINLSSVTAQQCRELINTAVCPNLRDLCIMLSECPPDLTFTGLLDSKASFLRTSPSTIHLLADNQVALYLLCRNQLGDTGTGSSLRGFIDLEQMTSYGKLQISIPSPANGPQRLYDNILSTFPNLRYVVLYLPCADSIRDLGIGRKVTDLRVMKPVDNGIFKVLAENAEQYFPELERLDLLDMDFAGDESLFGDFRRILERAETPRLRIEDYRNLDKERLEVDKKSSRSTKEIVLLACIDETIDEKAAVVADVTICRTLSEAVPVIPDIPKTVKMATPGSKSISNRALFVMAALSLLKRAKSLWEDNGETFVVEGGRGALEIPDSGKEIYLGNADTAARFLTTICAPDKLKSSKQMTTITGNACMKQRPIGPLVDGLRENGAFISYLKSQGCLPLSIPSGLKGSHIRLDASISSQCLICSALDMTIAMMRVFCADIQCEAVKGIHHIKPIDKVVQVFFERITGLNSNLCPGLASGHRSYSLSLTYLDAKPAVSLMEELSYGSGAVEVRVDLSSEDGNAKTHNLPSLGYVAAQVVALRRNTLLHIIYTIRTVS